MKTAELEQRVQEAYDAVPEASRRSVFAGTHNFLGGKIQHDTNQRRVDDGTHHFLGENNPVHKRVADGIHHTLGPKLNQARVDAGTHNFLGGTITRQQIADGRHASQIKKLCIHCGRTVDAANYSRWHGDKCKLKGSSEK